LSPHRLTLDHAPPAAGATFTIVGDEAWHAVAVKRVQPGDRVELLDGRGGVAAALVTATDKRKRDASVQVRIERVSHADPVSPRVEVWSAVPKADRAGQMIDQLAQTGAALWRPLVADRSVTEVDHKVERLQRIATEASKQCGRAWHMELGAPATVAEAAKLASASAVVVADAAGALPAHVPRAARLIVLIGPEGGFTAAETDMLQAGGAVSLRLGPHVLRTETAAVAAVVALLCR